MTMNTPEHAAARHEVAVRDALQPLRDAAAQAEAGARELQEAVERGDPAEAGRIGEDLLAEHVRFGQVFRRWLAARPDLPGWRPSGRPGSEGVDRMSV